MIRWYIYTLGGQRPRRIEPKSASAGVFIACQNLQNPFEKCVLITFGPSREALFSIMYFIQYISDKISYFRPRIFSSFPEKVSPGTIENGFRASGLPPEGLTESHFDHL